MLRFCEIIRRDVRIGRLEFKSDESSAKSNGFIAFRSDAGEWREDQFARIAPESNAALNRSELR